MSQSNSHSFPLLFKFSLGGFLLLAAAAAQDITFPKATRDACNLSGNYPCFNSDLCCPVTTVCTYLDFGHGGEFCIDASAFPVDGGSGGRPSGGIFSFTTELPGSGVPVVISTRSPVPGGNSGSSAGGEIVATLLTISDLPSSVVSPVVIPTPSPSPSGNSGPSAGGTNLTPVPGPSILKSTNPLLSTSTPGIRTSIPPVPSPTKSDAGGTGGNNNSPVTPLPSSTIIATSLLPSSPLTVQSGGGGGGGTGSGAGSASNGTSSNGNGPAAFTGAAAPRSAMGFNWWGEGWGWIIAAGVIACVGAVVVE
ncbi:hypothetical protein MMC22_006543 [Lobaria immixta]|nr:hypothetical protein [Lobaria immixta]